MQDQIFDIVLEKDDVSWKMLLYELVNSEQMNPWDVDVSVLAQKYIETIKKMNALDFRISGKVILAAALLLKLKSVYLFEHGLARLDQLLAAAQEQPVDGDFFADFANALGESQDGQSQLSGEPHLIPRTPQPRRRKVSVYDLAEALQKALEVKIRKIERSYPDKFQFVLPKKKLDIGQAIRDVYGKIRLHFFKNKGALMFTELLPKEYQKEAAVFTFIPLLHLSNQRKIDLSQREHFGPIEISLAKAVKDGKKESGKA